MPERPPIKCPKCAHLQFDPQACERCGLVFSLVAEGETPWEKVPPGKEQEYAEATTLWQQVERTPADASAHADYVAFLLQEGLLDHGIQRYRHRVADHPEEELAAASLKQLVDRATATAAAMLGLASHRARKVERKGRVVYNILIVVVSAGLVYALWIAWQMLRGLQGGGW